MNHRHLTVNGQKIDGQKLQSNPQEFKIFKRKWLGDPAVPEFIANWWDKTDTIPAFTSGSTAIPQRINLKKDYAIKSARATLDILGLKPGSTALLSMPAHYIAGRMMLVRAIVGQLNLSTVLPSSTPEIPDITIDLAAFTPHQFQNILNTTKNDNYLQIKNILLGGSPVQKHFTHQLNNFPGRIFETFGMTETYSHIALRQIHPIQENYFNAVDTVTFSMDEGKLIIHAPHIGIKALKTNDLVDLDSPTRFHWLGRADNVINSGGIKLNPELIEKKLSKIIKTHYFITGQADKTYGEIVALFIERDPDMASENELRNQINQILDKYEKPKSIIWVDNMEMTATGKINRAKTKMQI